MSTYLHILPQTLPASSLVLSLDEPRVKRADGVEKWSAGVDDVYIIPLVVNLKSTGGKRVQSCLVLLRHLNLHSHF